MSRLRLKLGKAIENSDDLGAIAPGWQLCRLDEKWKVYATTETAGSANYGFRVANNDFDMHANIDARRMKQEQPAVFRAIQRYLQQSGGGDVSVSDEADPYGDIAISRRQRLTPDQQWRRGLLMLRMRDLEILAKTGNHGTWIPCIEMLHHGVYKIGISDSSRDAAHEFVLSYGIDRVNLEALMSVEDDYYSEKYRPNSCQALSDNFDFLTAQAPDQEEQISPNDIGDLL